MASRPITRSQSTNKDWATQLLDDQSDCSDIDSDEELQHEQQNEDSESDET